MITILIAMALTFVVTFSPLVVVAYRNRHSYGTPSKTQVVAPIMVSGLDTMGRAWVIKPLNATSVSLYRGATVYVDACGIGTLRTLSERYGITWEC